MSVVIPGRPATLTLSGKAWEPGHDPDRPPLSCLPAYGEEGAVHVVVETPKGSPDNYTYFEALGTFRFKMVLPEGTGFPYDFGMIPSTKRADSDPPDILILMDTLNFPGCVLEARLVGVIEVGQRERGGTWERDDRLIGVAVEARTHALDGLGMMDEIEASLDRHNQLNGKDFGVLRRDDADAAIASVRHGSTASNGIWF